MDDSVRYIQINPNDNASLVFTNTPKPSLKIVKVSVLFDDQNAFALAEKPKAKNPFAVWRFSLDKHGRCNYRQGQFFESAEAAGSFYSAHIKSPLKCKWTRHEKCQPEAGIGNHRCRGPNCRSWRCAD